MLKFLESGFRVSLRQVDGRHPAAKNIYLGAVKLDIRNSELLDHDDEVVMLRPQSMRVLRALAERPSRLMTKSELAQTAWHGQGVSDESLAQCIADIRRAVGDKDHRIIRTEPKKGYRLVPTGTLRDVPRHPWRDGSVYLYVFLAAALLAIGLLLGPVLVPDVQRLASVSSAPNDAGQAHALGTTPSIIILPFEDLDGDPRWQRISRGVSGDIANELARNKWLSVFAPDTALALDGSQLELGRTLDVDYVIDGNFQTEKEVLRVTARLARAATGKILWSRQWAGPSDEIFKIRDEIVAETGTRLGAIYSGKLSEATRNAARERPPETLNAYELLLLGAAEKHKFTAEGYLQAVDYFMAALEIDPDYAQALVQLAMVRAFQSEIARSPEESLKLRDESFRFARRAYELDPDNPDAIMRMGVEAFLAGDLDKSFEWASRSVDAAPNNADILATAAWLYYFRGDDAHDPYGWARRAIELNPAHPEWYNVSLGLTAFFAGDLTESIAALRAGPKTLETIMVLGAAEALAGNMEKAHALAEKFRENGSIARMSDYWGGFDIRKDPRFATLVEGAQLAGFPI